MSKRCRFTADFKAKVALEAQRGEKTIQGWETRSEEGEKGQSGWRNGVRVD